MINTNKEDNDMTTDDKLSKRVNDWFDAQRHHHDFDPDRRVLIGDSDEEWEEDNRFLVALARRILAAAMEPNPDEEDV